MNGDEKSEAGGEAEHGPDEEKAGAASRWGSSGPDAATLMAILEHAPGYILLVDLDLRIRYLNRTAHGWDATRVVGSHYCDDFLVPAQRSKAARAFELARETGTEQSLEVFLDTPLGGRRWMLTRIALLHGDGGVLEGFITITTEVTEEKKAELRLKKLQADLQVASHRAGMAEVATGVLHNVGNVLNSVNVSAAALMEQLSVSHVEMLARAVKLCDEQGDGLPRFLAEDPRGRKVPALLSRLSEQLVTEQQDLRAEVQRLVEHVNIIRSTVEAQQSAAKTGKVLEDILPGELVDKALSMFRIDMEARFIEVTVTNSENRHVCIDRQASLQILVNLIRNAIEALADTKGTRRIDIKIYSSGRFIHFEVIDNGCGISEENLAKIFQHGFTTKRSGHGFGLHSSIVSARAMGGVLNAQSAGLGKGASFCLSLPQHMTDID